MSDLINPATLTVGQYVKFTCNHPTDITTYEGKIVGIVNFDVAKSMEGDLIPYYREAAKSNPDLAPYDTLKYFILEYTQGDMTLKVVRAAEWINVSSLVILDPDLYFDIRIYNQDKGLVGEAILNLLKSNKYTVGYTPE